MKSTGNRKLTAGQKDALWMAGGVLISMLATAALTSAAALAVAKNVLRMELSSACAYLIIAFAALLGCGVTALFCKHAKLIASVITGTGYYLMLIVFRLLFRCSGTGRLLPTAIIILGAAVLCGFLGSGKRKSSFA